MANRHPSRNKDYLPISAKYYAERLALLEAWGPEGTLEDVAKAELRLVEALKRDGVPAKVSPFVESYYARNRERLREYHRKRYWQRKGVSNAV